MSDAAQHDRQRRHRPAGERSGPDAGGPRGDDQHAGGEADGGRDQRAAAAWPRTTSDEGGQARGRRPAGRARPRRRRDGRFMPAPSAGGASATGRRRGAPARPGRAARSRRRPAGASAGCGRCRRARASAAGRAGTCRRPTAARPSSAGCQEACGTRSHAPDGHAEGHEHAGGHQPRGRRGTRRCRGCAIRRPCTVVLAVTVSQRFRVESTVRGRGATAGSLGLHYPRRRVFDPS